MTPDIGVVVVNWNRKSDTLRCLSSLKNCDYPSFQVLIVDNGSNDGSIEAIQSEYPEYAVMALRQNTGFTGGNNIGIQYFAAKNYPYIFLLNNDAVIDQFALRYLVETAEKNPDAGLLGAKIMMIEQPNTILSAGGILVNDWQPIQRGIGEVDSGQYDGNFDPDYLSGCAVLVRKEAFEKAGGFDDEFFAYNEDVEWSLRIKNFGYRIILDGRSIVWHPDTRTRDENSPFVTYYIDRNVFLLAKKQSFRFFKRVSIFLELTKNLLSWTLRPKWRYKRLQRNALFFAIRDALFGRFGKMSEAVAKACR